MKRYSVGMDYNTKSASLTMLTQKGRIYWLPIGKKAIKNWKPFVKKRSFVKDTDMKKAGKANDICVRNGLAVRIDNSDVIAACLYAKTKGGML